MALNKTALKAAILAIHTDMRTRENVSDEEYADRLSTAIDTYVKQAAIIYVTGLITPDSPVTGNFEGHLQ